MLRMCSPTSDKRAQQQSISTFAHLFSDAINFRCVNEYILVDHEPWFIAKKLNGDSLC